ncbi:MAG: hypothetical protein Q9210_003889 [Variospora velana]
MATDFRGRQLSPLLDSWQTWLWPLSLADLMSVTDAHIHPFFRFNKSERDMVTDYTPGAGHSPTQQQLHWFNSRSGGLLEVVAVRSLHADTGQLGTAPCNPGSKVSTREYNNSWDASAIAFANHEPPLSSTTPEESLDDTADRERYYVQFIHQTVKDSLIDQGLNLGFDVEHDEINSSIYQLTGYEILRKACSPSLPSVWTDALVYAKLAEVSVHGQQERLIPVAATTLKVLEQLNDTDLALMLDLTDFQAWISTWKMYGSHQPRLRISHLRPSLLAIAANLQLFVEVWLPKLEQYLLPTDPGFGPYGPSSKTKADPLKALQESKKPRFSTSQSPLTSSAKAATPQQAPRKALVQKGQEGPQSTIKPGPAANLVPDPRSITPARTSPMNYAGAIAKSPSSSSTDSEALLTMTPAEIQAAADRDRVRKGLPPRQKYGEQNAERGHGYSATLPDDKHNQRVKQAPVDDPNSVHLLSMVRTTIESDQTAPQSDTLPSQEQSGLEEPGPDVSQTHAGEKELGSGNMSSWAEADDAEMDDRHMLEMMEEYGRTYDPTIKPPPIPVVHSEPEKSRREEIMDKPSWRAQR